MTPSDLDKLTDDEKRVKIAILCSWKWVENPVNKIGGYWERGTLGVDGYERGDWGSRELGVGLPDYLSDLNAMNLAEHTLDCSQREKYAETLYRFIPAGECTISASYEGVYDFEGYFGLLHATAAQRAEAFLRAVL